MSWTGKPCPFTKQILIKFKIFKMMALHGILVCDSEVHFQTWLFFPVVCFIHVLDQTSAEQLYRDKVYH